MDPNVTLMPGSLVVVHLVQPTEKYWGVLQGLSAPGITLRGLSLSSFEDWVGELASELDIGIGPSTVFFPMGRIERVFLDEPMGEVESLSQSFFRRVGRSPYEFLGPEEADEVPS